MFGFSLTKLVVLLVVIVFVWQGFKHFGRVANKAQPKETKATAGPERIDTVECTSCGVYVSAAASGCGRKDCPYG